MIPYGKQDISDEDIESVIKVLKSDYLTQGPMVPEFEYIVSEYCKVKYAIAVNSATSALHISCLALGVGKGDIVWTSPITFVASANCALYCGASVEFVDIDSQTYNISINALTKKLENAEKQGILPKVIIPVHLSGQSCEMKHIHELSKRYGFKIIEDASHAIGGKYLNEPIGNCTYSDITVFSFHPVKVITSGEGGMAVTNDNQLATDLVRLRSHGIVRHPSEMTKMPDGPWHYQQIELGFNYRMTDIHAALGISQMKRIDEFIEKRHAISERYDTLLKDASIIIPYQHPDSYSGSHLYIIRVKNNIKRETRLQLFERLRSSGILVNLHYIPVYKHPYYEKIGYKSEEFPEAEAYYSEAISLPLYFSLTNEQQDLIVNIIKKQGGFQNLF
jgi:UDP-4-amino-4,6-dideoxy-N-acetyl-beta-L-altrosamine transaminase